MGSLPIELNQIFNGERDLIAAVLQEQSTNEVLMLGWMNREALKQTIDTGRVTFWSRSRNSLWVKGETSGNFQDVVSVTLDCDHDALLIKVKSLGPACHTGESSCFHNALTKEVN
jgi:phosphoribosyl-AMP cyclohydrolase